MNNRFPIYIISKGRYKRRPTANMLEEMNANYYIVVEEHEFNKYKQAVKGSVLILPRKYIKNYDRFWNDDNNKYGPGAARNFCWDHSVSEGYTHHWVMDDNIEAIERYNNNLKIKCLTTTPFYIMEDFVLRYENIALSGPNYSHFCPASEARKPLYFNTRIYSTLLIRNDIPYRWRGRYNEDGSTTQKLELRKDDKTNTLTSVQKDNVVVENDTMNWRKLTPLECERLQTVDDNYTEGVSNTQRYKMLGNGWTIDVISHILNHIK